MERASGSENGDLIENCMKEGKIVPVEITISLIEKVQHFVVNVYILVSCFVFTLCCCCCCCLVVVVVFSSMKEVNVSEFLFQSMSLHVK